MTDDGEVFDQDQEPDHEGAEPDDPEKSEVCPNCGGIHTVDTVDEWQPVDLGAMDRDITAIVMAILNGGTVRDFAELVADEARAPAMLLRTCQFLAQLYLALAHTAGETNDHEEAMEIAKDMLQRALLEYSLEHETKEDDA